MNNGKVRKEIPLEVEESSGNVFADLELDNPEELLAKSKLLLKIRLAMEKRGLSEAKAARQLGITRTELHAALRGDLDLFSIAEIKRFLQSLGAEDIDPKEAGKMKTVPLSDGSGNWFDTDLAKSWSEKLSPLEREQRDRHDPHGEKLYLTNRGTFILNKWNHSIMEDLFLPIDQEKAARWLVANGYQKDLRKLELLSEERKLEV